MRVFQKLLKGGAALCGVVLAGCALIWVSGLTYRNPAANDSLALATFIAATGLVFCLVQLSLLALEKAQERFTKVVTKRIVDKLFPNS